MCVETLRTGLVYPRQSIWEVTCLHLLEKWTFSNLSPWKPQECVLKSPEQGLFLQDNWFEGSHAYVYSKNKCFPLYLLENPKTLCWNPQKRDRFSQTINLRGHMPTFTWKMNIFQSISLETPKMCVETLRTGFIFPDDWCEGSLHQPINLHIEKWINFTIVVPVVKYHLRKILFPYLQFSWVHNLLH